MQEQDNGEATRWGSKACSAATPLMCVWRIYIEQAALPGGIPDVPLNGDADYAAAPFVSSGGIGK